MVLVECVQIAYVKIDIRHNVIATSGCDKIIHVLSKYHQLDIVDMCVLQQQEKYKQIVKCY